MATLSLAMIVKNEEATLARVLACAKPFCDEMIVVDTGSTDRSVEIAEAAGAKVFHFVWIDDFAAARNYSFAQCTSEWVLWLDADDVLPARSVEAGQLIKDQVLSTTTVNSISCPYNYIIDENGVPILTQGRERFIRRAGALWVGRVHETVQITEGTWGSCPDFVVDHYPTADQMGRKKTRNLDIFKQYLNLETCSSHELFLYAGELLALQDFAGAAAVYWQYIDRYPKDKRDALDEKYAALLKLAEAERQNKRAVEALQACALAIAYDCSRGEAYGQMGVIHNQCGNIDMALAAFRACATMKRPTKPGLVVFDTFYGPHVLDSIKELEAIVAGG